MRSVLTRNVIEYFEVPGIIFRDYTRDSRKIRLCVLHIEEGSVCVLNSNNARGQETLVGNNEASDGARPPWSAAASGRLVSPALDRRLSLLGSLGWAGAAPKPHAASSDADTAIELLSEVVTWSVLVWFGRQRGMKSCVCNGLDPFLGAVGGLLCARGRRASRCGRSGGPASRD